MDSKENQEETWAKEDGEDTLKSVDDYLAKKPEERDAVDTALSIDNHVKEERGKLMEKALKKRDELKEKFPEWFDGDSIRPQLPTPMPITTPMPIATPTPTPQPAQFEVPVVSGKDNGLLQRAIELFKKFFGPGKPANPQDKWN